MSTYVVRLHHYHQHHYHHHKPVNIKEKQVVGYMNGITVSSFNIITLLFLEKRI